VIILLFCPSEFIRETNLTFFKFYFSSEYFLFDFFTNVQYFFNNLLIHKTNNFGIGRIRRTGPVHLIFPPFVMFSFIIFIRIFYKPSNFFQEVIYILD
jgi:hypothetical protein